MRRVLIHAALCALLLTSAAPARAQGSPDLVARVKADLVARGVIPSPQVDNCDAFQITIRVAWILRAEGARVVLKQPAQNGCTYQGTRYSHDALAFPTGWVDLLASAGPPQNENRPVWQWHEGNVPTATAAPFDLDAPTPPVTPPVITPPVIVPPVVTPPAPEPPVVVHPPVVVPPCVDHTSELRALLTAIAARLERLEAVQAKGVSGRVLGFGVSLKP